MGETVLEMPTLVSGYEWEPGTGCDDPEPRFTLSSGSDGGGFFIVPGTQDDLAGQALSVLDALMNPDQKVSDVAGVCRHCGRFVYMDDEWLVDDTGATGHPEPDDEDTEWIEDHEIDPDADPTTGLRQCCNGCDTWVRYDGIGAWVDDTDGDGCDPAPRLAEMRRKWGRPVPDRHRADVPELPNPDWTPNLPVVRVADADDRRFDTYWLSLREPDVNKASDLIDQAIESIDMEVDGGWDMLVAKLRAHGIVHLAVGALTGHTV